jgi:rsbT co-antagonist protein RsbR
VESVLAEVTRRGARFAIVDLTGVEAMDTATAAYLLKLIQGVRLLGAEGILTGISPSVAQAMVALGIDLARVTTLADLREGLRYCIQQMRAAAI